jgi:uncharacterized protein YjbI with pentapeptide repeats
MREPKRGFEEKAKIVTGLLVAVASVATAVTRLHEVLQLGRAVYPLAAILAVVGLWIVWDGFSRRSRLLHPEALLLRADKIEHLAGRAEDVDRLSKLCADYAQVHLVGESGAGKSALLQAGLCPAVRVHARLIPIYVDVWGQDWEVGPRIALASALWEALSERDRDALGLTGPPGPDDLLATLRRFKEKCGREPLLIFDQFDDYQTRHQPRFLPGRRRTWLPADRLVETNSFWRDVKELVEEAGVHCLFVTRTDTADGLESIRFVPPQVYRLDRLNVDCVPPLLASLTPDTEGAEPVVFAPERGWNKLKDRLARDLAKDGAVLPAQMKTTLQGLASLNALTIPEYERKGSLRGLEAAHVERHVSSAARNFNLTKSQVRMLLASLVEREALKTVPRSTADLQGVFLQEGNRDPEHQRQIVPAVLDYLEQREIIRRRLDPDTRQHVWILDHDYLCRGVLEAEHQANRWFILIQESQRAFREAGRSLGRKWKSLLSPWNQMVLVGLRLVGRFQYGEMRSFAALSLLRFLPLLVLGSAILFYSQAAGRHRAWQAIESARGKPGDLGRLEALQYLNKRGISLARIDLSLASLPELRIEKANLQGAILIEADLPNAVLSGANLMEADLTYAKLPRANLVGADLRRATLTGADLRMANLTEAKLSEATLVGADLTGANLLKAVLVDANLCSAKLVDANLADAELAYATLVKADLTDVNLPGAGLYCTILTGADLYNANLLGIKDCNTIESMEGANICGIRNAPAGFEDWATKKKGAVCQYPDPWAKWKRQEAQGAKTPK